MNQKQKKKLLVLLLIAALIIFSFWVNRQTTSRSFEDGSLSVVKIGIKPPYTLNLISKSLRNSA